MIIGRRNHRSRRSTNVGKDYISRSVGANAPEIEVAQGWADGLVERRPQARTFLYEIILRISIPSHAQSVNIEEFIPSGDFLLRRYVVWVVVKEFWQVMVMYLAGDAVLRSDEDILEETCFLLRYVHEPADTNQ